MYEAPLTDNTTPPPSAADKDKRPSFQFYPGDWMSDLKLRRCSPAARGVWVDVLCALHDSDDGYGFLRWTLKELAKTVGASMTHMRELVDKGVLRGSDTELAEPLVYVPRSGRKTGAPVVLIATQPGPIWYSKRLVKDEHIRTTRGESSRFGASPSASPKGGFGDVKSDGSSTSSPSPTSLIDTEDKERAERAPPDEPDLSGHQPTEAGLVCRAMRLAGFSQTNPGDPVFVELLKAGATEAEFVDSAKAALASEPVPKGWGWVLTRVKNRRAEAAQVASLPQATPRPSSRHEERITTINALRGEGGRHADHAAGAGDVIDVPTRVVA